VGFLTHATSDKNLATGPKALPLSQLQWQTARAPYVLKEKSVQFGSNAHARYIFLAEHNIEIYCEKWSRREWKQGDYVY
tara:strand:- start:1077 stop:1313 length:237 start_codon:yes stop_codon:yes gene_type:complete